MDNARYEATQQQIMLIGALVRELPLDAFLERACRAESAGALFAPSHWIAGREKLELVIKLAERLRAFQAALPTLEQAQEMDEKAARLAAQLGVGGGRG